MKRIVKDPGERRGELIASAQQFFYTKGYENTSVGDIVESVGVAKGTFYYYFDTKQAVLEAIVADLVDVSIVILREIVADESLDALDKWSKALTIVNSFKLDHREELLKFARALRRPENLQLQHKLRTVGTKRVNPEMAKIIRQGVAEGVFKTVYPAEAAEIAMLIMETLSESLTDLLLMETNDADSAGTALRKAAAAENAIELVLGAPPGSMRIFSSGALDAWFQH